MIRRVFVFSMVMYVLCSSVGTMLYAQEKPVNVAAAAADAKARTDAPFSYQGKVLDTAYTPALAIDGDRATPTSRWVSHQSKQPHYLEVAFAQTYPIHQIVIYPDYPASTYRYGVDYVVQYWNGRRWQEIPVDKSEVTPKRLTFDIKPTAIRKIRYYASRTDGAGYAKLFEIEAYATLDVGEDAQALTFHDYPVIPYALDGEPMKLSNWKAHGGDNMDYADPAFDDSDWPSVRVGESIVPQIGSHQWVWYRTQFDLPDAFAGRDLLFDLGRVSAYDEVYVNGVKAGSYGTPPPRLIFGCSNVYRKYPIPASMFRPGRNVLSIRVYVGHRGGLSNGDYTLQPMKENALLTKMALKSGEAPDALLNLLSGHDHLNQYAPGSDLLVKPLILKLFGSPLDGELAVTLLDGGKPVDASAKPLSIQPNAWNSRLFRFQAPTRLGKYQCRLTLTVGDQAYWSRTLDFEVVDPAEVVKFVLPVDERLRELDASAFPADISSVAVGRYGPRQYTDGSVPVDLFSQVDSRAGLTLSARISAADGAPLLFTTNVRPTPQGSPGRFHAAAGHQYDGLQDAWLFGKIVVGDRLQKMEVVDSTWAKRTYRYAYHDESYLDFSLSAVSPAIMIGTNSPTVRWFEGMTDFGIGLPSHMAYEQNGKLVVVDASEEIDGRQMTANYVLVWFNGAEGWEEFDIPLLFTLETRPTSIRLDQGALAMSFPSAARRVQLMPIFGVTLQTPASTADWSAAVPPAVLERCRYWSRVLVNAPDQVHRRSRADYEQDELVVLDEFSHLDIRDDWGTRGLKIAPLTPTLPLAAAAGNIAIAVSEPVEDLGLATLYGPLVAAEHTSAIRFSVGGLLHLVREVREMTPATHAEAEAIRSELNRLVAECLEQRLGSHPWDAAFRRGRMEPGLQTMEYVILSLCLPYLDQALREKIEAELKAEVDTFFLTGVADPSWRDRMQEDLRDKPLVKTIRHPVTGLELSLPYYADESMGVDAVYYEGLRLYGIWQYAYIFDDYARIHAEWDQLKRYFNVIRNSHDWSIGLSWDSLSGLRLGNGLQESGIMHAAGSVMARMARRVNDPTTEQEAAYYAVSSAVAMQAALHATDYLTWRRPWSASHSYRHGIETDLKSAEKRHVEFNALGGFSQFLIGSGTGSVNSPGGYIESPLPAVMRPYQEVWTDFTNAFYDPSRDTASDRRADERLSLDAFVYQVTQYPQSVKEVFEFRLTLPDTKVSLWNRIIDHRAYLDSMSQIGYRKLW